MREEDVALGIDLHEIIAGALAQEIAVKGRAQPIAILAGDIVSRFGGLHCGRSPSAS